MTLHSISLSTQSVHSSYTYTKSQLIVTKLRITVKSRLLYVTTKRDVVSQTSMCSVIPSGPNGSWAYTDSVQPIPT